MAKARPDDPVLQLHLARLLLADGQTSTALPLLKALSASHDAEVASQAGDELRRLPAGGQLK